MNDRTKKYIESIHAPMKENGEPQYKRFNRKNFNGLLTTIMNDSTYSLPVAKIKNGELADVENVPVSMNFRKFIKKQAEAMGIDKAESSRILTEDFQFSDSDGMYDLMTAAMLEYMNAGNAFDFPTTPDLKASLKIKNVGASVSKPTEAFHPQTRESLGTFITEKKDHKVMKVSSQCPKFLKNKKPV